MLILGIETSTKTGGVALVSESGIVAQYNLNIEVTHSERLMATVHRVLQDTGTPISQIDAFAVAIGPGSFTGLRIGIATIKGLAVSTNRPVAAVPTLEALAANLPYAVFPVCPLLDARKNEVYAALYRLETGHLIQMMPETTVPVGGLGAWVSGPTIFTGEGAQLYRRELQDLYGDRALFAPLAASLPSAASVAEAGLSLIRSGGGTDPDSLSPLYIRRPEAEVAWEKRQTSR